MGVRDGGWRYAQECYSGASVIMIEAGFIGREGAMRVGFRKPLIQPSLGWRSAISNWILDRGGGKDQRVKPKADAHAAKPTRGRRELERGRRSIKARVKLKAGRCACARSNCKVGAS